MLSNCAAATVYGDASTDDAAGAKCANYTINPFPGTETVQQATRVPEPW